MYLHICTLLFLSFTLIGCGDLSSSRDDNSLKDEISNPIKNPADNKKDANSSKERHSTKLSKSSIEYWGAKCGRENAEITTKAFYKASDYNETINLTSSCEYFLDSNKTLNLRWKSLSGNNSTISFLNDIEGNGINFLDVNSIKSIVFNGNNHSFSKSRDTFMINIKSKKVIIENSSFINVAGKSTDQYALGIDWNTDSDINNCLFKQITTHTNVYNTGGFTGGIYITDDESFRVNRKLLRASTHKIINSKFEEIYTLKQENGDKIYPDSDGIRNYSYGFFAGYKGEELENLKNSKFIVDNCKFKNVLKSGTKLNYSKIYVSNSIFEVDDIHQQDNIYSGFRFQTADMDVELNNLQIKGENIRFGIIYTGSNNLKANNIIFNSTYKDAHEFLLGGYGHKKSNSKNIEISNSNSNKNLALLRNVDKITFDNININPDSNHSFTLLASDPYPKHYNIDNFTIKNSSLTNGVTINPYNRDTYFINTLNVINTIGINKDSFKDDITIIEDEIHTSFNSHVNYFKDQLKKRLPSTSYVLYDVQTFLQNAAIYADEKNDIYMLNKLLKLIKTPLEEQYLTDRMWIEKEGASYGNIGNEVELCVSQYFSLLTRVLSACERHEIDTNLTENNKKIIEEHINKWIIGWLDRWHKNIGQGVLIEYADREGFFVMSALQYYNYLVKTDKDKADKNFDFYSNFLSFYMENKVDKAWSDESITVGGIKYNLKHFAKNNFIKYFQTIPNEFAWSTYGSEIKDISSDTDPLAMFYSDGTVKQQAQEPITYADDISHGRRYIWFFETIKRFGKPFKIKLEDEKLKGFANTLAYKVCRGTKKDPHFTIYVDGTDGWYRVGYRGKKSFGYSLGEMDISFVGSSYGMMGVYNPKIYDWMDAWAKKNPSSMNGYHGAYKLDYYTSKSIDMSDELIK